MVSDEIYELISDAVSSYANSHWNSDDFNSDHDRAEYLEGIANGDGDIDYVIEEICDSLDGDVDLDDDEVMDAINDEITSTAEFYMN